MSSGTQINDSSLRRSGGLQIGEAREQVELQSSRLLFIADFLMHRLGISRTREQIMDELKQVLFPSHCDSCLSTLPEHGEPGHWPGCYPAEWNRHWREFLRAEQARK